MKKQAKVINALIVQNSIRLYNLNTNVYQVVIIIWNKPKYLISN